MILSVITINYNNREGLEKTLQSVFAQTYRDFEFIVIDGASGDGSVELLQKHQNKISFWLSEKDNGIYNAQNKGLAKARGEYCLFLNSGDWLASTDVLEKAVKDLSADIAYGNMKIVYREGNTVDGFMPERLTFKHMMTDTLWHPVSFIRRSLLVERGGYNEKFRIASDYDFFLQMILVKKVSTQHLGMFISCFDMGGVSTDPGNRDKLLAERRTIQLQYFHPSVIELFDEYSKLNALYPRTFLQKVKNFLKPRKL